MKFITDLILIYNTLVAPNALAFVLCTQILYGINTAVNALNKVREPVDLTPRVLALENSVASLNSKAATEAVMTTTHNYIGAAPASNNSFYYGLAIAVIVTIIVIVARSGSSPDAAADKIMKSGETKIAVPLAEGMKGHLETISEQVTTIANINAKETTAIQQKIEVVDNDLVRISEALAYTLAGHQEKLSLLSQKVDTAIMQIARVGIKTQYNFEWINRMGTPLGIDSDVNSLKTIEGGEEDVNPLNAVPVLRIQGIVNPEMNSDSTLSQQLAGGHCSTFDESGTVIETLLL